jgi:CRP-like cAMP-binding protein
MPNILFSGKLEVLKLAELIQIIGNNELSGTLKLQSHHHPVPGRIYFRNGNPVESDIGPQTGIEALYTLFGWLTGDFIFSDERTRKKRIIHKNRMGIVMDGLRLIDEGKIKIIHAPSHFNVGKKNDATSRTMAEVKGPLVDYVYVVDEESFSDGDVIASEGRFGGWIWIVLSGRVEVVKKTKMGDMGIFHLSEGAFVGGLASLLPGEHMRSAAAIARGSVQLGVLDVARLAGEYAGLSPAFRRFVIGMDQRLKEVTSRLIDIRENKPIPSGVPKGMAPFSLEGERKGGLFVIKNGNAAVVSQKNYGHVQLARLSPGDFFGHVPFLEMGHEPDAASIYSSPDFQFAPINSTVFQTEYHRQSTTLRNLMGHVSACICVTTQLLMDSLLQKKEIGIPPKTQKPRGRHRQSGADSSRKAMTEKRKTNRIKTRNLSCILVNDENTGIHQGMGRTLNLSETGILLQTHFPIEPGYTVMISIGLAEELVDVKGKVVHQRQCKEGLFDTGICFIEVTDAAIQVIRKFVQTYATPSSAAN